MRVCDPACGSGGMLIECAKNIKEKGGNPLNISLYGQEKNINTWAICKMNMLLHGLVDAHVERGDTIRDPKLVKDGELILFDRVIENNCEESDETLGKLYERWNCLFKLANYNGSDVSFGLCSCS